MTQSLRSIINANVAVVLLTGVAGATGRDAAWTPEGADLVFSSNRDGNAEIYLTDSAGNVASRLTDDAFSNGVPVFSQDGSPIAFYSDQGEQSGIVVMDADGSNRRTVVSGGQNWYPRWSPDVRCRVNYRVLYFFHGRNVAVLVHALTKGAEVPAVGIERAIERKTYYENDPHGHTYEEEL